MTCLGYHFLEHPNRGAHIVKHRRHDGRPFCWVLWLPIGSSDEELKRILADESNWFISFPAGDVFHTCFVEEVAMKEAAYFGVEIESCECCQ